MKRYFFVVALSVALLAMMALCLAGCGLFTIKNEPPETTQLELPSSFEYDYGSFNSGGWSFKIVRQAEQDKSMGGPAYRFTALGYNGVSMDVNTIIDESVMISIAEIIEDCDLASWDGFNKHDSNVLDGYSFDLLIEYQDHSITAHGYMVFPNGYDDAHAALSLYLEDLVNSLQT